MSTSNFDAFKTDKPIPEKLRVEVEDRIVKARAFLLINFPFFGNIITRMPCIAADKWLGSMATDGKYIYFNHEFINNLTFKNLAFVLAHEVLHVVYEHMGRQERLNQDIFRIAADFVINDELTTIGVGEMPKGRVAGLYDPKYHGWYTERVYDDLKDELQSNSKKLAEMMSKQFDEHMDDSQDGDESSAPTEDGPAKISASDRAVMKSETVQAVITAAQNSGIGNLPAGVQIKIGDLTEPKMDWKTMLATNLTSLIPCDYSFLKMSRYGWHLDAILPGVEMEKAVKIEVMLDSSGSCYHEAAKFLSEVNGIMQQYPSYEIGVTTFDTKCYNRQVFSSENGEDITTYEVLGGGGTDGGAIFRFIRDEGIETDRLVIFTDGYVGDFGSEEDNNRTGALWIIAGSKEKPPYGQYAYYEDFDK